MASKELTYLSDQGPFEVYDKRKLKEPISSVDEYKEAVLKAIEGYDKKQAKPVRFNFFKNKKTLHCKITGHLNTEVALKKIN